MSSMPVPSSGLTIRDATRWDVRAVVGVLASTALPTTVGQWLEPDPVARAAQLRDFYLDRAEEALRHGALRLAEQNDTPVAAAMWLPCHEPVLPDRRADLAENGVAPRMGRLLSAVWRPHLAAPHLRLAGLGVLLRGRRQGVATALLTEHQPGLPAWARCITATGQSLADRCARWGYRRYGGPVSLPAGVVVQPMLYDLDMPMARLRDASARRSAGEPRRR